MQTKNIIIAILVLVLIGAFSFLLLNSGEDTVVEVEKDTPTDVMEQNVPAQTNEPEVTETETPVEPEDERGEKSTIGTSVEGNDIEAYHFGSGETEVLLIGGIHGGYSPNTSALANELIAHFTNNPDEIPDNVLLTVIPELNPDGLAKSGTEGRFNANEVDLNRNFDCEWSETAIWREQEVSGGSAAFSEPEALAIKNYVETYEPTAAVVWFSAEGKVYPSACGNAPSKQSVELAATFATAANYGAQAEFDAYAITGDMVNWLADQKVTAISVLLSDHQSSELNKNQAGVEAVLKAYAE